jgi:predicted dienelactone hydrolase
VHLRICGFPIAHLRLSHLHICGWPSLNPHPSAANLRPMQARQLIPVVALSAAVTAVPSAAQAPAPAVQAAPLKLPKPTGPFTVGTTTFRLIDPDRVDQLADPPEPRQIVVHAWYPAVNGATGQPAPYLRDGPMEVRAFATQMRQPVSAFDYLADLRTHGVLDAPPRTGDPLPVLLFSLGYTAIGSSYTALLEDLASHGYAVFSLIHPYESMAVTLADGRVVTMLDEQQQLRTPIRKVFDEWAKEGDTMTAVTRAKDEAEAMSILRGYLKTLPATTAVVTRWVDDTVLVLDRLPAIASGPAARLAARLDLSRVGAFGHSMGGVTAADFCARDRRCRAGLNLDGIPQYGSLIDSQPGRPFLMVYSGREGRLGASDAIYRRATRPYVRVDVADTMHLDFSDMVLWGGPLAGRPIFGKRPATRAVAVTRQIVREFFEQELNGRRSPLLSGRTALEGVRVH